MAWLLCSRALPGGGSLSGERAQLPTRQDASLPFPHQLWAQLASNTSQVSTWQAGAVIHAPPAGFVASPPARVCKTFLAPLPIARD